MFSEDDLLPISALQHLAFCERQWGLIHLEGIWAENRLTVEGAHLHEQAHESERESRADIRIVRGMRMHCLRLGLSGIADVVEFHRISGQGENETKRDPVGVHLKGVTGLWRPLPVEYKRGRPKPDRCDEVQLCAQSFCIGEMLDVDVGAGAIFYGKPRKRQEVVFDESLREETEDLAARLHQLFNAGSTPRANYQPKCRNCSLLEACMPKTTGSGRDVDRYLINAIDHDIADAAEQDQ